MYDTSLYNGDIDAYCSLYQTTITGDNPAYEKFPAELDNIVGYVLDTREDSNTAYILGEHETERSSKTDRALYRYEFIANTLTYKGKYDLHENATGIKDVDGGIVMLVVSHKLFVANNESMFLFDDAKASDSSGVFMAVRGF